MSGSRGIRTPIVSMSLGYNQLASAICIDFQVLTLSPLIIGDKDTHSERRSHKQTREVVLVVFVTAEREGVEPHAFGTLRLANEHQNQSDFTFHLRPHSESNRAFEVRSLKFRSPLLGAICGVTSCVLHQTAMRPS